MDKLAQKKLEVLLEEESKDLSIKERRRYLKEVSDYILNVCPKHYIHKCSECGENCKGEFYKK